jgi:5-methylcytosine-specific restriction protein A
MSRNKDYQRLLNSKRWKQLREWKLNESPLCEMCAAKGLVVAAVDVHHKIPCESARTIQEIEALCFNPSNLQSLCVTCHKAWHTQSGYNTKPAHKQREKEMLARWIQKHNNNDSTGTS